MRSRRAAPPTPLKYRPELDGVRAIAVLAVLGFHIAFVVPSFSHVFRGGFIGVDIFFVLSGMLITELLVHEHLTHASVSLRGFYRRRSQRLLPALVVFVVVTTVYFSLAHSDGRGTLDTFSSLASYVTIGHVTAPLNSEVSQVWTLIVEWEFYLIWPMVLITLLRRGVAIRAIGYGAAVTAMLLTGLRAVMYHSDGHDFVLNYYLAGLRFDQLLLGCAVGLLGALPKVPWWLRTLGLVDLLIIIGRANVHDRSLAYGGTLAIAVGAAYVVQPRAERWWLDGFLSSRPMVWIGKLSYSLYLWSVPASGEVSRHTIGWSPWARVPLFLTASFAAASASYYLVERRFRLPSRRPLAVDA
jgi:peptidoglycan/LPS O-acetylase OafA/YrhL